MSSAALPTTVVLLILLGSGNSSAAEPQQNQSQPGVIYRCRTADGGNALVSKPDASLSDCVQVTHTTPQPGAAAAPALAPTSSSQNAGLTEGANVSTASGLHPETSDEHDARLKKMAAQLQQWCTERATKETKPKDLQACVNDKMETYLLLHP